MNSFDPAGGMGIAMIIMIVFLIFILAALGVLLLLRIKDSRDQQEALRLLQRQMQDEIDRSRQDTVEMVQSSVRHMGEMIARSQSEFSEDQSRRLNELNHEMNDALQQVFHSLGEMRSLASGVDDLKKVLSNVKSRGILGEVQLGAILQDTLAPDQFEENVAVTGSQQRVEYAVRLPGDGGDTVYLPIDSKFPADTYMNLLDAYEMGDPAEIRSCRERLRRAILKAAADIKNKYILPPKTCDFGIMFLPFEGLYAEILRLNLTRTLMNDYRVNIAGPTTMAAMLSSFRMGFRSLALAERSGEVWDTLSGVSAEFEKYDEILQRTQKHLQMAQKDMDELIGPGTRRIRKALSELTEYDTTQKTI